MVAGMDGLRPPFLLLYDGVCGLCNRMNQFVLARDRKDQFRFASLQSATAQDILKRHGQDPAVLSTFFVVLDPGTPNERLMERGAAARFVLKRLGGGWGVLGTGMSIVPRILLNAGYDVVAANRYRMFGKEESCWLPTPEHERKFLDAAPAGLTSRPAASSATPS